MFVDASGRRGRTLRRFGWAVTIVCACYATTVAASLVGGDSGAPFLRIPGVTEGMAEAVEAEGEEAEAVAEAERPTRGPTIRSGTLPSDRDRVAGVVPPSATADPDEPVGRVAPVAEGGVSDERDEEGGTVADTAPAQPAPGTTPPAGGSAGTPPADPQNENETGTEDEADPPAEEPAGNGNPVDGLLGGLLGLPPLLGG
ncbi:hypothetical protein [Streptomyces sp. NPDC059943]|uniref:hypothetical protein n=1 Tax=Streptomyces sp. NPDC059943 TaxID=3347010 RepID=UPI0036686A0C